jgi:hypothetical protein
MQPRATDPEVSLQHGALHEGGHANARTCRAFALTRVLRAPCGAAAGQNSRANRISRGIGRPSSHSRMYFIDVLLVD